MYCSWSVGVTCFTLMGGISYKEQTITKNRNTDQYEQTLYPMFCIPVYFFYYIKKKHTQTKHSVLLNTHGEVFKRWRCATFRKQLVAGFPKAFRLTRCWPKAERKRLGLSRDRGVRLFNENRKKTNDMFSEVSGVPSSWTKRPMCLCTLRYFNIAMENHFFW